MGTRTSTQARSHAQKFFVKIEKRNKSLEDFLKDLDLSNLEKDLLFSDLDDDESLPNERKESDSLYKAKSDTYEHQKMEGVNYTGSI